MIINKKDFVKFNKSIVEKRVIFSGGMKVRKCEDRKNFLKVSEKFQPEHLAWTSLDKKILWYFNRVRASKSKNWRKEKIDIPDF